MILDIVYIMMAVLVRMFGNKRISGKLQEVIIGRYLEQQSKKDELTNDACELFSDDATINSIFSTCHKKSV